MSSSISAMQVASAIERAEKRCEEVILPVFGEDSRLVFMIAVALTMGAVTTELIGEEGATSLAEETVGLMGVDTANISPTSVQKLLQEIADKVTRDEDF